MEATARLFPCPPCAAEGVKLVQFDRDFVEMKQGHAPKDAKNFLDITGRAVEFAKRHIGTVKITGNVIRPKCGAGKACPPHS
jgi:hypothetical protein